jgi:hypothetical protein
MKKRNEEKRVEEVEGVEESICTKELNSSSCCLG